MFLVLTLPHLLWAQKSPDVQLLSEPVRELNNLPNGLTDIEVDEEGNIFLLQSGNHRIYKYFHNTNYDSVLTIGGKGIKKEGFNYPSELDVQNRQNCFVLDYMNRRLLLLNTNLKVTKEYNFLDVNSQSVDDEEVDIWPISFAAGPTGELYILNQNDLKIYKLDTYGRMQTSFGGLDYGGGSLTTPDQLTINPGNYLFAADTTNQMVAVFDLYGIFQYKIYPTASFKWHHIAVLDNYLVCIGQNRLYFEHLLTRKTGEQVMENSPRIIDVEGTKDYFYILHPNKITVHRYK
ncbi:MAG: hypothetical protein H6581_01670 [Bacteroidia bacterium]|nr:hypothetical protein [Bacteroidia bacterium]